MKRKRGKVVKLHELLVAQTPNKTASLIATVALNIKNSNSGEHRTTKFLEAPEANLLRIERALCF